MKQESREFMRVQSDLSNPLNCSDHAPKKYAPSLVLVLLVLVSAIALTACNPTEFKTEAAQVSQLVDSALAELKPLTTP